MRTEREAEMDGFKKGLDMQIDLRFLTCFVIGGLGFCLGFVVGLFY